MAPIKKILSMYREAYAGLPREAWLLSLVELINRSGSMVFFYMTLYVTQTFGFSTTQAGQVLSAFGLGALGGAYLGGKLTDILGAYNVQKLSLALTGVTYLVLGRVTSYGWIVGLMFFLGIVSEALHPANATALSQVCPPELRTKGFALNRLAINLGVTIGPAVGGYLALIDYGLLFWIDGFTCLSAAGLFAVLFKTSRPAPGTGEKAEEKSPPVWKDFYFLKVLAFVFVMALIFFQLFNTFPLFLRSVYGLRENRIGLLIAINTVIIVLLEMILMEALKKKRLESIIGLGMVLLGGGFALMPLGRGFWYAAFTVVVWTFGEMLAIPPLATLIANHSSDAVRGKYMGLYSLSFSFALLVGPALGARIYDTLSPDILWYGCGVLGVFLWLGFHTLKKNRALKV